MNGSAISQDQGCVYVANVSIKCIYIDTNLERFRILSKTNRKTECWLCTFLQTADNLQLFSPQCLILDFIPSQHCAYLLVRFRHKTLLVTFRENILFCLKIPVLVAASWPEIVSRFSPNEEIQCFTHLAAFSVNLWTSRNIVELSVHVSGYWMYGKLCQLTSQW